MYLEETIKTKEIIIKTEDENTADSALFLGWPTLALVFDSSSLSDEIRGENKGEGDFKQLHQEGNVNMTFFHQIAVNSLTSSILIRKWTRQE